MGSTSDRDQATDATDGEPRMPSPLLLSASTLGHKTRAPLGTSRKHRLRDVLQKEQWDSLAPACMPRALLDMVSADCLTILCAPLAAFHKLLHAGYPQRPYKKARLGYDWKSAIRYVDEKEHDGPLRVDVWLYLHESHELMRSAWGATLVFPETLSSADDDQVALVEKTGDVHNLGVVPEGLRMFNADARPFFASPALAPFYARFSGGNRDDCADAEVVIKHRLPLTPRDEVLLQQRVMQSCAKFLNLLLMPQLPLAVLCDMQQHADRTRRARLGVS